MYGTISFTSPHNRPVPTGDTDGAGAIAGWLAGDIQYSVASIDLWLDTLSAVADGTRQPGYLGTGNAYSVLATPALVLLACEHVEHLRACLALHEAKAVLQRYRASLANGGSSLGGEPAPFRVQYLAEGDEATSLFSES